MGIFCSSVMVYAQGDSITQITFTYDDAGNRTDREIVYYQAQQKSSTKILSDEELEFGKGLAVYPNPAREALFITLHQEALEEPSRFILLYDGTGRLILQSPAEGEVSRVDVSNLTDGTYILRLIYGTRHKEWTIIKH